MSKIISNKEHKSYEMYWSDSLKNSKICPKCGTALKNEYQTYLAFMKIREEADSFVTGNNGGYFCPSCPVVVLDKNIFEKTFRTVVEIRDQNVHSFSFTVSGIVDYDAVPEDKRDKELGTKENPLPIIYFKVHSKKNTVNKTKSFSSRKIGRNDPCLCGSGKKYKKCCGRLT